MTLVLAQSDAAKKAFSLVESLQKNLVAQLEGLSDDPNFPFHSVSWLRSGGQFGGGNRYMSQDVKLFNRASVNISQVQYEADAEKKLNSATALSTIIHPRNPFAPSLHMHISWTEMKSGDGYWRIMADLNPSLPSAAHKEIFERALQSAVKDLYQAGKEQGERYFHIPALGRHRGIAHFYLEEFRSADPRSDRDLAERFGFTMSEAYMAITRDALQHKEPLTDARLKEQLDYHSLYFLQVLTLDRGTTSGILVHDENDVGILGSLPSHVDKDLLKSWLPRLPELQVELLQSILNQLDGEGVVAVDDAAKKKIAEVSRKFYREHPAALDLLARGDRVPPTQENHR